MLREHLPGVEVWACGSRVSGRSHDGSDLDLVLRGPGLKEIPLGQVADFEEAVRESNIPFLVEARDWACLPERSHREIERGYVVLVRGSGKQLERSQWGGSDEWRETVLGDLIDIAHGFAFKGHFICDEPHGDVLLTPGNFAIGGGFKSDKFRHYHGPIPDDFVLSESDLIVSMTDLSKQSDTLGYPAFVPTCREGKRYLHNQRLGKVSLKNAEADVRYIYYVMCGADYRHEVLASATGTTVKHTSPNRIKQFRFQLPPLPEQRAIAHILGTLDDKIELNRRMNETLEAMTRALFKSWFVDFDPVRAKVALRNHAALEGTSAGQGHGSGAITPHWSVERARAYLDRMDPGIVALFPDRFVNSELGEIPAGWKVERFDGHISAQRGLSYTGSGLCGQDEGLPMHNLNSIFEGGGYKHDGIKYYKGEYRKKHILKPGDLIVTNTEQGFDRLLIGHAAIVPDSFGPTGLYSHHIYRIEIRSGSRLTPSYLCRLFNDPRWHSWISGFSNGTTINMLPKDAFEIPLLVIPPAELVDEFTALDQNTLAKKESNRTESYTFATLRDALLPMFISGELRVGPTSANHWAI